MRYERGSVENHEGDHEYVQWNAFNSQNLSKSVVNYHLKTIINNAIQVVNRYWLQTGRHQPNQFTYILLRINDDEENTCTTWNYGAGFLRMWVRGKGVIIGGFFLSSLDLGMFVILKPIFAGSIWGGEIHWAKAWRAKCCGECALKGNFMKSLNFV